MTKAVALLSGGMDSTVAFWWAMNSEAYEEIYPFFVSYQQNALVKEIEAVQNILDHRPNKYKTTGLSTASIVLPGSSPLTRSHGAEIKRYNTVDEAVIDTANNNAYIPFRNGVLFSLAANALLQESKSGGHIITGIRQRLDQSGFPDCSLRFANSFGMAATAGAGTMVAVIAPLNSLGIIKSRADVIVLAETLDCFHVLKHTYSCHVGNARPCGHCLPCLRRAQAFHDVGAKDPAL